MQLLLVRHAQPYPVDFDPDGADPPLTEEGQRQADLLAKYLSSNPLGEVTRLVSSTMLRATQTAEPLAAALGLQPVLDSRIVEVDSGWTNYGTPITSYPSRRAGWADLNSGKFGGNSFDLGAFRSRVIAGFESTIAQSDSDSVAIAVCHGGVIGAYLSHILGTAQTFFVDTAYTSITRIHADSDGYRELLSVNETVHLSR